MSIGVIIYLEGLSVRHPKGARSIGTAPSAPSDLTDQAPRSSDPSDLSDMSDRASPCPIRQCARRRGGTPWGASFLATGRRGVAPTTRGSDIVIDPATPPGCRTIKLAQGVRHPDGVEVKRSVCPQVIAAVAARPVARKRGSLSGSITPAKGSLPHPARPARPTRPPRPIRHRARPPRPTRPTCPTCPIGHRPVRLV